MKVKPRRLGARQPKPVFAPTPALPAGGEGVTVPPPSTGEVRRGEFTQISPRLIIVLGCNHAHRGKPRPSRATIGRNKATTGGLPLPRRASQSQHP